MTCTLTGTALTAKARELGIPGRSAMKAQELRDAITAVTMQSEPTSDAPSTAEQANATPDDAVTEQVKAWMVGHGLLERHHLNADLILAARMADEIHAHRLNVQFDRVEPGSVVAIKGDEHTPQRVIGRFVVADETTGETLVKASIQQIGTGKPCPPFASISQAHIVDYVPAAEPKPAVADSLRDVGGLLKVTNYADSGAEVPRYSNFRVTVWPLSNDSYLDEQRHIHLAIEADDAETPGGGGKPTTVWQGAVEHKHVGNQLGYVLDTVRDQLAYAGFRVADGWQVVGSEVQARIEALPPMRRCRCGRVAHRVITPLDPVTGEPREEETIERCSLHAYDADVPQENVRERQVCWRGQNTSAEPRCLELIEFKLDERDFGGWKHVDRRITHSHNAAPKIW